ncbi:hypothetical protein VVD49_06570 [Uliginosibacterium sp. H3]|uniref:SMI1/KNR4 family protein n=1 Tax=Uliginosibacterium silvisoli TaxID=3114758 RepID=A0ABU6K2X8_9RHOO|nr:hypothetical protein [Uliginosibacterium sp. H3]
MDSWLNRYVAGEQEAVWNEIHQLGPIPRDTACEMEVRRVVDEAMRRARVNVETIVGRLQSAGYDFVDTNTGEYTRNIPHVPPSDSAPALIAFLEALVGPLPLTVAGWILTVGDVNLLGNHPAWAERDLQTDALVVEFEMSAYTHRGPDYDAKSYFEAEFEAWNDDVAEYGAEETGPFLLPFAPDSLHKINVSGGAPYAIYVPDGSADATCCIDNRDVRFIEYLRNCFACGGFPGEPSLPHVSELASGLLPI